MSPVNIIALVKEVTDKVLPNGAYNIQVNFTTTGAVSYVRLWFHLVDTDDNFASFGEIEMERGEFTPARILTAASNLVDDYLKTARERAETAQGR